MMFHELKRERNAMMGGRMAQRLLFYGFGAIWIRFKIIAYFILKFSLT